MKIYAQKQNTLTDAERLEIAKLLIKAGYTVRIGKERPKDKPTGAYIHYVEYEE